MARYGGSSEPVGGESSRGARWISDVRSWPLLGSVAATIVLAAAACVVFARPIGSPPRLWIRDADMERQMGIGAELRDSRGHAVEINPGQAWIDVRFLRLQPSAAEELLAEVSDLEFSERCPPSWTYRRSGRTSERPDGSWSEWERE